MEVPWQDLDQQSIVEVADWFRARVREAKGRIVAAAQELYEAKRTGQPQDTALLFDACELVQQLEAANRDYFAVRKEREAGQRAREHVERQREEQAAARELARLEGRFTESERREYRDRLREERARLANEIEVAHANPEPLPIPVLETPEERMVNDALRSRGPVRNIDTGNIMYRLRKSRTQRESEQ